MLIRRSFVASFSLVSAEINIRNLLRKMFHIQQTSSVEEYVERFADLYDQLTAYETFPNTLLCH